MSPPRAGKLSAVPPDQWQRDRLLQAGLPAALAETVARDRRYDLHLLLTLIDRGCRPDLAVRILAPLDT